MEDRERFERFLFAMIEARHDEAAGYLSDDVVWHMPPFANAPPLEGKSAVLKFLAEAPAAYYEPGSMRLEPLMINVEDGRGACLAKLYATTKKGKPYENLYTFFARLEGGTLCEVWELMDTASFQAQLRG